MDAEHQNRAFRFPLTKRPWMDFLRFHHYLKREWKMEKKSYQLIMAVAAMLLLNEAATRRDKPVISR